MSAPMHRRQFLGRAAALGGGLLLAGGAGTLLDACSSDTKTSTAASGSGAGAGAGLPAGSKATFQLGWLEDEQWAGEFVADSRGLWTSQGLAVTLLPGGPLVNALPVVQSGRALVTLGQPDTVAQANQAGGSFKIVAAKYQKAPYAITSLASKPLNSPQDMVGKKIGVSANNNTIWSTFLQLNNIAESSVEKVVVQFDPTPLAIGAVDGWLSFITDEPINLKSQGVDTHSFLFYDYGYKMTSGCYVVTTDTLKDPAKVAVLNAFLLGDIQGWQATIADPQTATDLSVNTYSKDQKLDPGRALATVKATNDLITARGAGTTRGIFTLDDEGIAGSVATVKAGGGTITADTFVPSLLTDLYAGKTAL